MHPSIGYYEGRCGNTQEILNGFLYLDLTAYFPIAIEESCKHCYWLFAYRFAGRKQEHAKAEN